MELVESPWVEEGLQWAREGLGPRDGGQGRSRGRTGKGLQGLCPGWLFFSPFPSRPCHMGLECLPLVSCWVLLVSSEVRSLNSVFI